MAKCQYTGMCKLLTCGIDTAETVQLPTTIDTKRRRQQ